MSDTGSSNAFARRDFLKAGGALMVAGPQGELTLCALDRDLVRLLAHYRAQKPPADRWRIVTNRKQQLDRATGVLDHDSPTRRVEQRGRGGHHAVDREVTAHRPLSRGSTRCCDSQASRSATR